MQVDDRITLEELYYHWEQDEKKHATMAKLFDEKLDAQQKMLESLSGTLQRHGDILTGISERFDKLNGSVAKHENRLNSKDVMDATTALTLQQVAKQLQDMQDEKKDNRKFWKQYLVPTLASGAMFLFILILTKLGILNLNNDPQQEHEMIQQAVTDALNELIAQ